ncbi:MAG: ABC transporter ATP-binding protein [Sulfuricaulis sp.]
MTVVIEAEDLGKKYRISHQPKERYTALRDVLTSKIKQLGKVALYPVSRSVKRDMGTSEEFWALRDVSFKIREGDRLGIIGRNGAGKSTLLKILSRITEPSSGRVTITGRVASLLEVGTGFHPELTGRENIFLNGAILGMTKAEIKKNFDEIVSFSDVEKFLDTPIKRYSSGMYMRLAFAVAAHLEPEILVIDEVLAVGDSMFQKKCLGKMEQAGNEGRTILFVSHNMNAVEQLCSRVILLDHGKIIRDEVDVPAVIGDYLFGGSIEGMSGRWTGGDHKLENSWFTPRQMRLTDSNGKDTMSPFGNDADVWVEIEGEVHEVDPALTVGYALFSEEGSLLYWSYHTDGREDRWPRLRMGVNRLRSRLPYRLLNEGAYRLDMIASLHYRSWLFQPGVNAPSITFVIQGGLSDSLYWMVRRPGILAPVFDWELGE